MKRNNLENSTRQRENQFTINRRDPNSNVGLPGRKASVLTIWPRYFLALLWHFFLYDHGTFITT